MTTTVVTRATGGTAQPVGVLYVEPDLQVVDAGSETTLAETGMNAPFLADVMSAALAHERCGVHLYRSVAGRTAQEELRRQYERFGEETLQHVRILEELITATGGDPMYVSGSARATEKAAAGILESTFLLAGSVDPATAELSMLEAVALAESKDHANWQLLSMIAAHMPAGEVRDQLASATARVLAQEEEHYGWARDMRTRMLFMLATGMEPPPLETTRALLEQDEATIVTTTTGTTEIPIPEAADEEAFDEVEDDEDEGDEDEGDEDEGGGGDGADDISAMTRDELYERAKQLGIEGRSQMSKDELANAVAEHAGGAR